VRKKPSTSKRRPVASEKAQAIAAAAKIHREKLAEIERTFSNREKKLAGALKKYRPRKSERGKIVVIGTRGGRIRNGDSRRGYAVYVNKKGRKIPVRKFSRATGKLEKTPIPRKISSLDISSVKSKRAKKQFLTSRINPKARGIIRSNRKRKITGEGTRFFGREETKTFYATGGKVSKAVSVMAAELKAARDSVKSSRGTLQECSFTVSLGFNLMSADGKHHWTELQDSFIRQFRQPAEIGELVHYFGKRIYAMLAGQLAELGFVLAGSAGNISRLDENKNKTRRQWTKNGFRWQGRDAENINLHSIEYRFDQNVI
jgi:hypothetical protein